jgi:hypothetical protein
VFSGLIDDFKLRLDLTLRAMIAGAIVAFAGVAAFACLLGALFVWTLQTYGAIHAWAVLGSVFLLIALLALIPLLTSGRRRRALMREAEARALKAEAEKKNAQGSWWQDPAMLVTGLQIVRMIGIKKMLPVLAVGAVIAGVAMSRQSGADAAADEMPAMHPAE